MTRRRALILPFLLVGGLVACSSDDSSSSDATTAAVVTSPDSDPTDESTTTAETTTASSTEESANGTVSSIDGTTGASSEGTGQSAEFCGPMEALANYNANAPVPDVTGDWDALKSDLLESAGKAMPLYDDAIVVAPDEVRDDLETLRDYSDEVLGAIEESSSFEDFFAAVGTPPSDVLTAAQDLNAYISEECGFELSLSGSG